MLEKPLAPLVDDDEPDELSPFSSGTPLPSLGGSVEVTDKDRFRARTLSLVDDPSGAAADLVERWLTLEANLEKLRRRLSQTMAKHSHNSKYIARCQKEWDDRCLRVLIEKEFALRSWWPGIAYKLH